MSDNITTKVYDKQHPNENLHTQCNEPVHIPGQCRDVLQLAKGRDPEHLDSRFMIRLEENGRIYISCTRLNAKDVQAGYITYDRLFDTLQQLINKENHE